MLDTGTPLRQMVTFVVHTLQEFVSFLNSLLK